MANIAIDARPMVNPTDGIARYTYEIVSRITRSPQHKWYLFTHAPLRKKIQQASCRLPPGYLSNSLTCSQVMFPKWAKQDSIDIFWSPRHHLPLFLNTKSVVTIHDLCWQEKPETMPSNRRTLEKYLTPMSLSKADVITTVSHTTLHDLVARFNTSAATYVVPPGIQNFSQPHHTKRQHPFILNVGTIEPRKNHLFLLEAYARVLDKVPHNLVIVGRQGWGGIDLEAAIRSKDLEGRVKWVSDTDDQALARYYAEADLYVTCSTYEGFNLPILEAISCGTPIMASDIPVHREVAGECARYAPLNTSIFAHTLQKTLCDRQALKKLADYCPEKSKKYSWDKSSQQMLDIFSSLLR